MHLRRTSQASSRSLANHMAPLAMTTSAGYVMVLSTLVRYLYKLGGVDMHPANLKDRGQKVVCIRGGRAKRLLDRWRTIYMYYVVGSIRKDNIGRICHGIVDAGEVC